MNWRLFYIHVLCLFLTSCSTVGINDQTKGETPTNQVKGYSLSIESHDHGAHYWFPERKICHAIRKSPKTLKGYHPIHVIETFPSPYEHPLKRGYNFDLKPQENLSQKLSSGKVYGRTYYACGPRDSFVYKQCMNEPQKTLVDNFISTMRACYGASFGIYIEKFGGGTSIEGNNGRDCATLSDELIKVHIQGYQPSLFGRIAGSFGGAEIGPMIKALDRCSGAEKRLDMNYVNESEKLYLSCKD